MHFLLKKTFDPNSKFVRAWDSLIVVLIVAVFWLYSFEAGFSHYDPTVGYCVGERGVALTLVKYLVDLVLIGDVIMSMKKEVPTLTGGETATVYHVHT